MKFITSLLFAVLSCVQLHAQPGIQVRLKTGFTSMYHSGVNSGYAYQKLSGGVGSVVIGAELSRDLRNNKGAFLLGFTFTDEDADIRPNLRNLYPENLAAGNNFGFVFSGGPARTFVYAGFEKYIHKDEVKTSRNFFSAAGGLGLMFTMNKLKGWATSYPSTYLTKNGGTVQGMNIEYDRAKVAPAVFGSLRYHVRNEKGREVLILELAAHAVLSTFYQQHISYTLNGQPQADLLKEKGNAVELNVIIPLFGGRKH